METGLGEWGIVVEAVREGIDVPRFDNIERHAQGQSADDYERADGERDALRVIAGKRPLRNPESIVTPAYVEGWQAAADLALGA